MKRPLSITWLAAGLVGLTVTTLLFAGLVGIIPDRAATAIQGRVALSEAVVLHVTHTLQQNAPDTLRTYLHDLVQRNDSILSVAVRDNEGQLLVCAGDHAGTWDRSLDGRSTPTQMQVALKTDTTRWGTLEMRFRPLRAGGFAAVPQHPVVRLIALVVAVCFPLYLVCLRKVVRRAEPICVVPEAATDEQLKELVNVIEQTRQEIDSQASERVVPATHGSGNLGR